MLTLLAFIIAGLGIVLFAVILAVTTTKTMDKYPELTTTASSKTTIEDPDLDIKRHSLREGDTNRY